MKKLTVVTALLGSISLISFPVLAAETKQQYVIYNLKQGPFFKLTVSGRYLVKNGKEIGRREAERRATNALLGLTSRGWISPYGGVESRTIQFLIKIDVTAIVLADRPPIFTETRVEIFSTDGKLVASRRINNDDALTNPLRYREALASAVEEVQIQAITKGHEVWTSVVTTDQNVKISR